MAVFDQRGDRNEFQIPLFLEFPKIGQAGHATVLLKDLTNDSAWMQAGQRGQIHCCLGMSGPFENSSERALREHVPGCTSSSGLPAGLAKMRIVLERSYADSGCNAFGCIDRNSEISPLSLPIVRNHARNAQAVNWLLSKGTHMRPRRARSFC